jgi:hypothetical protein
MIGQFLSQGVGVGGGGVRRKKLLKEGVKGWGGGGVSDCKTDLRLRCTYLNCRAGKGGGGIKAFCGCVFNCTCVGAWCLGPDIAPPPPETSTLG